jgi:hypothetical protein
MQTPSFPLSNSVFKFNVLDKQQHLLTWCAKAVWHQLFNFLNPTQLLLTTISNALGCETALATLCNSDCSSDCNSEPVTNEPNVEAVTKNCWQQLPRDERAQFTYTAWHDVENKIFNTWTADLGVLVSKASATQTNNPCLDNKHPTTTGTERSEATCPAGPEAAGAVKSYFTLLEDVDIIQEESSSCPGKQLYANLYALLQHEDVEEALADVAADVEQSIEAFFVTDTQFNHFIEELYNYGHSNNCGNNCGRSGKQPSTSTKFENTARDANKSKSTSTQKHTKLTKLLAAVMQRYLEQLPAVVDSKLYGVNEAIYMAITHYAKECTRTVHQRKRKREFEHQSKKCRVRHS